MWNQPDAEPFRVLRTDKVEEQGKRKRVLDAVYDHEKRVLWREVSPNPQAGYFDFSRTNSGCPDSHLLLADPKLEPGKSFDIPVTDAGKVFTLSVAVAERKEIDTVLGRVNTIRIEPALFGDNAAVRAKGNFQSGSPKTLDGFR
jgi:hypothetical protein